MAERHGVDGGHGEHDRFTVCALGPQRAEGYQRLLAPLVYDRDVRRPVQEGGRSCGGLDLEGDSIELGALALELGEVRGSPSPPALG